MSARAIVIGGLTRRVGFPFAETELSPVLRRRVGEISDVEQQIAGLTFLISQKMTAVAFLRSRKSSQTMWLIVSAVLGDILLIVIVGVLLFVVTYVMYRRRQKSERLINERTLEIANLNTEIATLRSGNDTKLSALASEIFNELSSAHQVKVASSNSGSTVQFVRETIKEVVMVPCGYCRSLIPQASPRCPNCGATRKS